jgi:hypothetical protein
MENLQSSGVALVNYSHVSRLNLKKARCGYFMSVIDLLTFSDLSSQPQNFNFGRSKSKFRGQLVGLTIANVASSVYRLPEGNGVAGLVHCRQGKVCREIQGFIG